MTFKSIYRWSCFLEDIILPYNFNLSVHALGSPMPPAIYKNETYMREVCQIKKRRNKNKICRKIRLPYLKGRYFV